MRTPVYLTTNRQTVLVTVNLKKRQTVLLKQQSMSMIRPTRLRRVRTLIKKSDGRLPAGRNDRNVKWQENQAITAINSLLARFSTVEQHRIIFQNIFANPLKPFSLYWVLFGGRNFWGCGAKKLICVTLGFFLTEFCNGNWYEGGKQDLQIKRTGNGTGTLLLRSIS